jgi:NAD(P)-dependent dehydrogenase (short-subunit alcohol dehydrogenase family)
MSEAKKNVVITGSSSGFGLKAAKDFADKGYNVFATLRNPEGRNAGCQGRVASPQRLHPRCGYGCHQRGISQNSH